MIWLNPWAWLGLSAVAIPVVIHLLGRGRARVQAFPSLRFIERSKLLPARRTRIHDPILLLVRIGVLAAAAAALARPWFATSGRTRALDRTLARAIVVDSSASVRRGGALDSARSEARRLAGEARTAVVIETATPSHALRGAAEWLEHQPGRRELVIISDFQTTALGSTDLAVVPAGIGLRAARIGRAITAPLEVQTSAATATVALSGDGTTAEWRPAARARDHIGLALVTSAAERASAEAAARAASSIGARLPFDSSRAVTIMYPSAARQVARQVARRADVPWMTSFVASLRADPLLLDAASLATPVAPLDSAASAAIVVARTASGRVVVVASRDSNRLELVAAVGPGTVASAALIAAVDRARSAAPPLAEFEPTFVSDSTIAAWQRPPGADTRASGDAGDSDGRWFWIVALVLLGVETWLRRTQRRADLLEPADERAA